MSLAPAPGRGMFTIPHRGEAAPDALLYASIFVVGLLAWLLCHPYRGLFHDASLYALLGLARLTPDSLSHDVFLSLGSQDRYTLFSPLYARVIALLGLEHAAALLTLLSQAALCVGGWMLARALVPRWAAATGVVLLLALPGEYGALRIFSCVEPFLTSRMMAESFTLGALAALQYQRRALALILALCAVMLHPVMALAGLTVWLTAQWLQTWHGNRARALGIAASALAASLGCALWLRGRFDAGWLEIVQERSPYLFLSGWSPDDYYRSATGLLPLAAGALVFGPALRRACLAVLLATVAGWIMTVVGADLLHAVLITQAQPWRIEWLACTAAALLLPYLLVVLWRGGAERQTAALLIVAALIFNTEAFAALIGLAALVLLQLRSLNPRYARLLLYGAVALCVLAALWRVASNLEFMGAHYLAEALPAGLRRAMSFAKDGAALATLLAVVLWLNTTRWRVIGLGLLCVSGSLAAVYVARFTLSDWLAQVYPPERIAAFEAWRALVPPHAQVFWNDAPLSAWVLLQRAHYLSGLQSSGVVFSEASALELERRAARLAPAIAAANFLQWNSVGPRPPMDVVTALSVCRLGVIDYVVSEFDIGATPVASLALSTAPRRTLRLYRCASAQ